MERRAQIPKPPSDPPPAPERKPNGEPAEEPEERPPVPPPGPPYEIPPEPPPTPRAYWSRKAAVTPGQPALHHDAQRRKAGSDGHAGAPPPSARRSAGAGRTPYPGSPPFGTASSPAVPRPWLTPRCSSGGGLINLNLSEPPSPETPEVRKVEEPRPHVLLASADARGLVASVRAVVERESGHKAARNVTLCNLLDTRKPCRAAARGGPRRDLGPGWPRTTQRGETVL